MSQKILTVCATIAEHVASKDVDLRGGCITQRLGSSLKTQQQICLTGGGSFRLGTSRQANQGMSAQCISSACISIKVRLKLAYQFLTRCLMS